MKIVICGEFPSASVRDWLSCFPAEWELCFLSPERVWTELGDADVLIPEHLRVDAALLEKAPRLKLVQTGAGHDNVDLAACTRAGVQVCCAAGVNAVAVAEHVMAFLLCWYKNILSLDRGMKDRLPVGSLRFSGAELSEKTVGVVGFGAVGRKVAGYCAAFGMKVLACSRSPLSCPGVETVPFERLCRESDVVTLHVPLTEETRGMIDASAFSLMKPDALLVNTSRGAVVREADLLRALREKRIGGACLDVYEEEPLPVDHPLRGLENVILTPHTAGYPDGVKFHRKRCAFFVGNIRKVLCGETPDGLLAPLPSGTGEEGASGAPPM